MPTYEYRCKSCGEHLEVVQSFKDEPLTTCPGCGGDLRKVFGNIGIAFKGSGFYKTDSRAGSSGSKSPKSDTAKSDGAKTDTAGTGSGSGTSTSTSGSSNSSSKSGSSGSGSSSGSSSSGSGSSSAAAS